jgi:hypothetical protein
MRKSKQAGRRKSGTANRAVIGWVLRQTRNGKVRTEMGRQREERMCLKTSINGKLVVGKRKEREVCSESKEDLDRKGGLG